MVHDKSMDESGLLDINELNYYELLVNQGDVNAMVQLGTKLIERGYEPDYKRAAELFKKAAEDSPIAAARLGIFLLQRGWLIW